MKQKTVIISLFFLVFFANATIAQEISIITGEIVPYSYKFKDQQIGVMSEIVAEISKRIGFNNKPESLPWARSIKYSLEDNKIIYPLARTKAREKQYLWIGPVINDAMVFFVQESDNRKFTKMDDFKHLMIGVIRAAPPGKKLVSLGFTNLQFVTDEQNNALKLDKGRIDAWFATKLICEFTIRKLGLRQKKFRLAFKDAPLIFYLGASPNLKAEVPKWQKTLSDMKTDGTYQDILNKNHVDQL